MGCKTNVCTSVSLVKNKIKVCERFFFFLSKWNDLKGWGKVCSWSAQQKFISESINDSSIQKQTSEPTTEFSSLYPTEFPLGHPPRLTTRKRSTSQTSQEISKRPKPGNVRMVKFSTQWISKWSLRTEIQTRCQTWQARWDRTPCDESKGWEFLIEKKKNSPLQVMTGNAKKESLLKAKGVWNDLQVA